MGAIGMQDIKAVTVLFPCYKNIPVARNGQTDEADY